MIYKEFNNYIYEYFFKKENVGETILMVVDDSLIQEFYTRFQTTEEELRDEIRQEFSKRWIFTLSEKTGIPEIIGFIAIQIYIVSLMQKEGDFSAREYNPRLEEYLNVSRNKLQVLYADYQDNLWELMRNWASDNNFIFHIPEMKTGRRSYIQYPLSQALLNREDLKKVPLIFQNVGLKPDEYLGLENFTLLIKESDENISLPNHYNRIKQRLQKQNKVHLLYLQLFEFYNNDWDGSYPEERKKGKQKTYNTEKSRTYLTISNELKDLNILNHDYECLQDCSLQDRNLLKIIRKYYNPFYEDILIFIKNKSYDEWIDCRYFELEEEHIIICETNSQAEQYIYNLDSNCKKIENSYCSIYEVNLRNKRSSHWYWRKFFSRMLKNYTFEYGLKLSRQMWMLGAGPSIRFDKKTDAWINGEKLTFNNDELSISCRDFEEGIYRLKVKKLPPEKFIIKKPKVIPNTDLYGWQVSLSEKVWKHNRETYQISGLSTWFPIKLEKSSVRSWVNVLTRKKDDVKNTSIVINAIKQSKK